MFYDHHAIGEFVLTRNSRIEVQARHAVAGQASVNSAIAASIDGVTLSVERALEGGDFPLVILRKEQTRATLLVSSFNGFGDCVEALCHTLSSVVTVTSRGQLGGTGANVLRFLLSAADHRYSVEITIHRSRWLCHFSVNRRELILFLQLLALTCST